MISDEFIRTGDLQDIASYPAWAQDMVGSCADARERVANHALFHHMRDAELDASQASTFLVGVWPVIEQFPQYMAQNLLKVQFGRTRGHDEARRYLIRNIRVEQNHADHWLEWALASGVEREDLLHGEVPAETHALAHWCWHTCERDSLAAGMAATNYAIEGVTGDWSALVCSKTDYELSFDTSVRAKAMKWLKLHARYDDEHPWEALEIICKVMGSNPTVRGAALIRSRVITSYEYMRLTLDHCLEAQEVVSRPAPLISLADYAQERKRA
ncbi:MAG TPA: iron-containing redox enzyme family protein [Methylibium sp.]|uniref:TenA family transcriptional regulator n=1 Tax=Methylibium sp. TaxID=2067992 RepID=UPI002DBB7C21|nr:iron-containing redox enzyme family protein [Methylibium sp.]HEU4460475.1 iron-containing redox enzyme family protein [Methylibium sp.]